LSRVDIRLLGRESLSRTKSDLAVGQRKKTHDRASRDARPELLGGGVRLFDGMGSDQTAGHNSVVSAGGHIVPADLAPGDRDALEGIVGQPATGR
jgi:hypothetical protein